MTIEATRIDKLLPHDLAAASVVNDLDSERHTLLVFFFGIGHERDIANKRRPGWDVKTIRNRRSAVHKQRFSGLSSDTNFGYRRVSLLRFKLRPRDHSQPKNRD
jgi:hypothetical protein